jgi:hypothetical protein
MMDRFLKRLSKKAKKGMRGWPVATVAFYGPDASRASKVVVGIVTSENEEADEMRDWKLDAGDVRNDPRIAEEMLDFITKHGVLSVAMTDRIIGCPHQEGIDYEGEWCPVCEYWKGRDRFTGERVQ